MPSSVPPLDPGVRIGGYELVRRIGRGGMAEVWCAKRISERRASKFVAIKVVADQYVGNPRYQRMFRSEAELSALLNHTNIVQVFDEGEDDGRSYLVMEWIDGVNLLKVAAALTFVDDEEWKLHIIAYIIGQLLYALSYAHSITLHDGNPLGIVHRDVSPQNVLISNNGEVKLTDFGIAHYLLEESSGVHVKGKVRYMSPEQLGGKTRDPRVDLYAVGAILHELLDGRRFRHHVEDQREMYLEVLGGKVPALTRSVPPELDALRRGLLEADQENRIPTAEAALEMLERYPGYGDARRDLMKLCGGLTGVLRPRVGPGGSRMYRRTSSGPVDVEADTESPSPGDRSKRSSGSAASEPDMPPDTAVVGPSTVQKMIAAGVESGPIGLRSEATDSQREASTLTSVRRPGSAATPVAAPRAPRRSATTLLAVLAGLFVVSLAGTGAYFAMENGAGDPVAAQARSLEEVVEPDATPGPSGSDAGAEAPREPEPAGVTGGSSESPEAVAGSTSSPDPEEPGDTTGEAAAEADSGTTGAEPVDEGESSTGSESADAPPESPADDEPKASPSRPPKKASKARKVPKSILTVAVDGGSTMEVKIGRDQRTVRSRKSESFRLSARTHSVKWRSAGAGAWKTTPVQVRAGCERQLRIPSTTVKTFGTCE